MTISFKRRNECCKELSQANEYLRATNAEQAARINQLEMALADTEALELGTAETLDKTQARIKALDDALLVCKSTLNLVRNEGYNLPGSSITYALGKINELIGE